MDDPGQPRFPWGATALIVLLAVVRSAIATGSDSFTIDEPYHIAAGAAYARSADFRLNPEHPPLVKLWVGAALRSDFDMPPVPRLADKRGERAFAESVVFRDNDPDATQARARAAMLVLNALLLMFLCAAVLRCFGSAPAVGTALFLALDPTVAAHLPVVMTDLPVALLAVTALLFLCVAVRDGRTVDLAAAALALGLALGVKHSGLIAAASAVGYGVIAILMKNPAGAWRATRPRALTAVAAVGFGALVVLWSLYAFRFAETRSGEEAFNRPLAAKVQDVRSPVFRGALEAMSTWRVVPRSYTWGLADTVRAGMEGRAIPVNLFGRSYRDHAPFYFFPTVLAAKLPLGLLALGVAGVVVLARAARRRSGWAPPAVALLVLGAVFLASLIRGTSYAGVRHALPLLVCLAVTGGIAIASGIASPDRRWRWLTVAALVAAAASALPRARPWEYYNELVGGPGGAHRHFADEGIDIGQRTRELATYYHERLAPNGEVPYVFYGMLAELERRGIRNRSNDGDDAIASEKVTGVFILKTVALMRNPEYAAFRAATPVHRMGNLFVYRGAFHLPWFRTRKLMREARLVLSSPVPDLDRGEAHLREIVAADPKHVQALIELGNVMVARRNREAAGDFYARALPLLGPASSMRVPLTQQIARVATEPLEGVQRLRWRGEE